MHDRSMRPCEVDADEVLHVSAKDQGAGWQRTITFVGSATHAKTDAERMVKGAEGSATSDNARKDNVEAQSQAPEFIPLKSSIGRFQCQT